MLAHAWPHLGRFAPKVGLKRFHTFGVEIGTKIRNAKLFQEVLYAEA